MKPQKPTTRPNDPTKAGAKASRVVTFGDLSRYSVVAINTRFSGVCWFVKDAEQADEFGLPATIRQEPTFEAAITGLT